MLQEKDFSQIQDYIIQVLPQVLPQALSQVLHEQPEFITTIAGMIALQYPRRDEFARLLDEVKLLREDSNRRFELMREEINQRFDQIDKRLGKND
ncbi:hypothetical protein [Candidatus Parabeggiatoa sp. HSG14]|uniref:hypothetical protein n=1 Tax=Candidatus Parabeggiatoa sp. HSG14 TaxID=3055593 RepID=UPI0025A69F22|nr:hypothetical protein [Thiotrichales bacterium HSG14]